MVAVTLTAYVGYGVASTLIPATKAALEKALYPMAQAARLAGNVAGDKPWGGRAVYKLDGEPYTVGGPLPVYFREK